MLLFKKFQKKNAGGTLKSFMWYCVFQNQYKKMRLSDKILATETQMKYNCYPDK